MLPTPERLALVSLASTLLPLLVLADTAPIFILPNETDRAPGNVTVVKNIIPVTYDNPLDLPSINVTAADGERLDLFINTSISVAGGNSSMAQGANSSFDERDLKLLSKRQPPRMPLRVLPIGDSITEGATSSDGNGYRLYLRTLLTQWSDNIDFVGARTGGSNNPDNQHEGYGGYKILDIQNAVIADRVVYRHANIILLHAGTNDIWQESTDAARNSAPDRLATLIENIICEDYDAVILVAKIVGNNYYQDRVDKFNAAVPGVVSKYAAAGYKIAVADHSSIRGSQLGDGVHPNDGGYNNMAQVWFNALYRLPDSWFTSPRSDGGSSGTGRAETCQRGSINWQQVQGGSQIALGAHVPGDNGVASRGRAGGFTPSWSDQGNTALGIGKQGIYRLADLDGDGRADYLYLDSNSGAIYAWQNSGYKSWRSLNNGAPVALGVGPAVNVLLADMNGDKRFDYVYLKDGVINIYWNLGPQNAAGAYGWGGPASISVENANIYTLVLGDVDGDGCADYIVILADKTYKVHYQDCTGRVVRTHVASQVLPKWDDQLYYTSKDIDGDGFEDLCIVHTGGQVTALYNTGKGGNLDGADQYKYSFAIGVGAPGSRVILADYDGDKKVDYWVFNPNDGQMNLYLNTGTVKPGNNGEINTNGADYGLLGLGAAVRLADLDGDGRDDYISVGANSEAIAYSNGGPYGSGWNWIPFAGGKLVAAGHGGATREQIQFADLNGDGRADYLVVNADNGAITAYLNGGRDSNGGIIWWPQGQIAAGVARSGYGVRFADLNGDGRADYIWLDLDGRASFWLNGGSGNTVNVWWPVNNGQPVANGVGGKREDIRFADIDGDGKADYLWVHPENGAVDVWYSGGQLDANSWIWSPGGQIAAGIGLPGKAIRFARIGTSGRADYVGLTETNGALKAYYNWCGKVIGGGGGGGGGGGQPTCGKPPYPPLTLPTCPDAEVMFCKAYGCDDRPFIDYAHAPGNRKKRFIEDKEERSTNDNSTDTHSHLVARANKQGAYGGNSRDFTLYVLGVILRDFVTSLRYPDRSTYLAGTPRGKAHDMLFARANDCDDTEIIRFSADDPNGGLQNPLPPPWRTGSNTDLDHPVDVQIGPLFLEFAMTGIRPDGTRTNLPLIPVGRVQADWRRPNLVPTRNGQPYTVLNDLVMHGFGDETSFQTFVPVRNDINRMKGRLFGLLQPIGVTTFESRVRRAADGDVESYNNVTNTLHTFFATFRYLNDPLYLGRLDTTLSNIRMAVGYADANVPGWQGILALWDDYIPNFFQTVVNQSYDWANEALLSMQTILGGRTDDGSRRLLALANRFLSQLNYIQIPGHATPN